MATTPKGYPYPVGTDRVMDGDDAIRALAEAVDSDALHTRCAAVGQAITASVITPVSWAAATENGCALTKTSATVWTVTVAGLYVVSTSISGSSQPTRANVEVYAGSNNVRAVTTGENRGGVSTSGRLAVGDTIRVDVFWVTAASVAVASWLDVIRVGR